MPEICVDNLDPLDYAVQPIKIMKFKIFYSCVSLFYFLFSFSCYFTFVQYLSSHVLLLLHLQTKFISVWLSVGSITSKLIVDGPVVFCLFSSLFILSVQHLIKNLVQMMVTNIMRTRTRKIIYLELLMKLQKNWLRG